MFTFMSRWFVTKNVGEKVLIVCHREELITQACETLMLLGLTYEKILPSTKKLSHRADVYVAMVETLHNRLQHNPLFLRKVGLVFADECHVRVFDKVYQFFPKAKIIGVTATPISIDKVNYSKCCVCNTEYEFGGICCGFETMEWTKPYTFSMEYENIVIGENVEGLIEFGQLVPELNFKRTVIDTSQLETGANGDFTEDSQEQLYGSKDAVFNVLLNYQELCQGKRTIIFNSSSTANYKVYEQFKEAGLNVRLYDSVNDTEGSRKEIVKWFKDNDDAILCNVNVFTAGFDCKEVEAVILNRATLSLSLYLQMVGRGGRSSDKIYKQSFIVIDGGGNIDRFGRWSDPTRDWNKLFFEGIGKAKPKKEQPDSISVCKKCNAMYPRTDTICPECGTEKPVVQKREPIESDSVLEPIQEIPPPNGAMIHRFTQRNKGNVHYAFKILTDYIVEMFILYRVSKFQYESSKESGELDRKVDNFIRNCYFYIIKQKEYEDDTNRKLVYVINKAKEKLEKHYADK